jgi:hypothetical protein
MGRTNQQRRADRQRRAAQQQRRTAPAPEANGGASPSFTHFDSAAETRTFDDTALTKLVRTAAAFAVTTGENRTAFATAVGLLTEIDDAPGAPKRVRAMIERMLATALELLYEGGWQPADVAHLVKREVTLRAQRLMIGLIAQNARLHDAPTRAPRAWLGQLDDLGVFDVAKAAIIGGHPNVLANWSVTERLHTDEALTASLQVLGHMQLARRQSILIEPPSRWGSTNRGNFATPGAAGAARDEIDAKALKTIRALLAKAEGTTFEAEAEAFTTKAQELMTRHSIDAAVLASAARGSGAEIGVESRRVHIDNPYADEKATFLSVIARVNGARSIWSHTAGFVTLMGFPVDLHLTDLLFTSLLLQATRASAEATSRDRRTSTPSFRRAFLLSYAYRIGERLEAAQQHSAHEAEQQYGASLELVLADRRAAVEAAYTETFPDAQPMRSRRLDAAGYDAGRAAADRAQISAGAAISRA